MSSSSESDDQGEFSDQENLMDVDLHESSDEDSDSSDDGDRAPQPSSFKRLSRAPVAHEAVKKSADASLQRRVDPVSDSSSSDDAEDDSESDSDLDTDLSDVEDVEDGGCWEMERLLDRRRDEASGEPEFLVKLVGRSFRRTAWVSRSELLARGKRASLQALERRLSAPFGDEEPPPPGGVDPEWLLVDRVIGQRPGRASRLLLVKWRGLGYASSTWEPESALQGSEADLAA
ncbi:hypothetical protein H632_c3053p0, partial [Helicosporidium sp. ATCC 50920]